MKNPVELNEIVTALIVSANNDGNVLLLDKKHFSELKYIPFAKFNNSPFVLLPGQIVEFKFDGEKFSYSDFNPENKGFNNRVETVVEFAGRVRSIFDDKTLSYVNQRKGENCLYYLNQTLNNIADELQFDEVKDLQLDLVIEQQTAISLGKNISEHYGLNEKTGGTKINVKNNAIGIYDSIVKQSNIMKSIVQSNMCKKVDSVVRQTTL